MSKWTLRGGRPVSKATGVHPAALRAKYQVYRHMTETAPVPRECGWYMIAEPQGPCTMPPGHDGYPKWEDGQ